MEIIKTQVALRDLVTALKNEGKTVGLVPTMGALHNGHLQLVKRCVKENDVCIVSIFVNPTQFNDKNDLAKYPRTLEADAKMLEENNCYAIFAPEVDEIYDNTELNSTFEFDFNGWIIEGNIVGSKYKIRDGQKNVMEVYEKIWFGEDTYFVDIVNPDNEVLCLMIALAIDSSHSSKSHDNKRALKHKSGGWI